VSPEGVDAFKLTIGDCHVQVQLLASNVTACIESASISAGSLPPHDPKGGRVLLEGKNSPPATFSEDRPTAGTTYYLLVVSSSRVSFTARLEFASCGDAGLYGLAQRRWYMSERGLQHEKDYTGAGKPPKEPAGGFQLFAVNTGSKLVDHSLHANNGTDRKVDATNGTFEALPDDLRFSSSPAAPAGNKDQLCPSTFEFGRIDSVAEFTASYLLQGKSWYTKWLTVLEQEIVVTRFETVAFLDIGGFVNINLMMDEKLRYAFEPQAQEAAARPQEKVYQTVLACLSHKRAPPANMSECESEAILEVCVSMKNLAFYG
jgi:hypothetical protein